MGLARRRLARHLGCALKQRAQTLSTGQGALRFSVAHRPRVTRRMHLEIDDQGELVVVVPRDWPDFYTRRLLHKNLSYVHRFLERARAQRLPPLEYADGGIHWFRGGRVHLRLRYSGRSGDANLDGNQLHLSTVHNEPASVRQALRRWYEQQARALFAERLEALRIQAPWANHRKLTLKLRRMRRTWGTCSREGVIRLNTHLIKAPEDCLDYVVAHELCHLEVMNHGPDFYALQERIWPDWRATRAWLRERGHCYTQE
jgi:predicted metal-dependent hydrolase